VKAGFKNLLVLKHLGGKTFRVTQDLVFYSAKYDREFVAPAGMETDLASIPSIAQSFCNVLGRNIRSAVLHDWNCTPEGKKANKVTQRVTDNLFLEGMKLDEVRFGKARIMYAGVRGFQRIKYAFKRGESYG